MRTLQLSCLIMTAIEEFPIALHQRAELRKGGFVDFEIGKLLGSRQTATDSASAHDAAFLNHWI